MAFPVIGGTQESGYNIDNSLRFNDNDSAYLTRLPSSAGNQKTWTWSSWIKFGNLDNDTSADVIFSAYTGAGYNIIRFEDKQLDYLDWDGTDVKSVSTNRLFRDVSAWYHIVVAIDMTQSTDSNRVKIYINGVQETSFATATYQPQNQNTLVNSAVNHYVGRESGNYYDGYMADAYLIDGQALAPTEFGETDDNGVWIPKNYTGSYGTNGFKLEFKQLGTAADATSIGADTSGNNNHLSQNNITPAVDRTEDTPTNNFVTLNPLNITASVSLSEGNTHFSIPVTDQGSAATMGFANGKWYWEVKCINKAEVGINLDSDILQLSNDATVGPNDSNIKLTALITNSAGSANDFRFNGGTETVNSSSVAENDIVMVAVDADNTKIYFGVNGTWMNSGDPAGGTGELKNFSSGYTTGNFITPAFTIGVGTSASFQTNFGNPPFSISSGNSDANGYGNFEYAVPSGYYALCTKNLAEYG